MCWGKQKSGFTLVEISIVLVIIGLITGGIIAAKDLIYTAQVRATVSDFGMYDKATNAFKMKYGCLPGDCANAYTRFGFLNSYGTTVEYGDSNGIIHYSASVTSGEMWDYWTHLYQAGMIPSATPKFRLPHTGYTGTNCYPANNGWMIYFMPELSWFGGYQVALDIPSHAYSIMQCHYNQWADYITPQTAYDIDSKMDDGVPNSGLVRSGISQTTGLNATGTNFNTSLNGSCITLSGSTYRYTISNTNYACSIFVKAAF